MMGRDKWIVVVALCGALVASCSTGQAIPQTGTETGNPPFLNQDLVALVVSTSEVRIVGRPGAVSPGGSDVQAVSALTGNTFQVRSRTDGSFDLVLPEASSSDTFELRASSGSAQSSVVYVVRGGAAVGEEGGKLSCEQREGLASAQMSAISQTVDQSCQVDADCAADGIATGCSESCTTLAVSRTGVRQLRDARAAIDDGICSTFDADGCELLRLPCAPPQPPRCVNRRCVFGASPPTPGPDAGVSPDCSSAFDPGMGDVSGGAGVGVYWYYPEGQVCLPRVYSGIGGNGNRYATRAECEAECSSSAACRPNRTAREVCISPGPLAGCAETATASCALLCESDEGCVDDQIGPFCRGGVCEQFSPL